MLADAQSQATAVVREARANAERVRADSNRELAAATQRRDSINEQLVNVRQMLTTLAGSSVGMLTGGPAPVEQPGREPASVEETESVEDPVEESAAAVGDDRS